MGGCGGMVHEVACSVACLARASVVWHPSDQLGCAARHVPTRVHVRSRGLQEGPARGPCKRGLPAGPASAHQDVLVQAGIGELLPLLLGGGAVDSADTKLEPALVVGRQEHGCSHHCALHVRACTARSSRGGGADEQVGAAHGRWRVRRGAAGAARCRVPVAAQSSRRAGAPPSTLAE